MSTTSPASVAPSPTPAPKPVRRAKQLPDVALALSALATTAASKWQGDELPALLWLTKTDFAAQAAAFASACTAAEAAGDTRTPQAARLKALDTLLDKGLGFVKNYLEEEYENPKAYYPEFGIEKFNKGYRLPKDRTERAAALTKLLAALVKYKFDKKKYGTAFWQPLATEYASLVSASTEAAGSRSGKVSTKVQGEEKVRKALRALIHHLKANYPDSFEARLREYGFQKESY
ncbi:hypothetical protein FY528_12020 [Hymenobacter lutimineralis]|uniref:Uncharacterized protein n=1 Tax=Hymenobacter lutimineralis TaxID=2606448 RepID=A0A5D6V2X7_9BACT|nr:hypothetical protein [Hymenobacter lutimineralis]TYZ08934.1 hypothetical protein FY528_12020 [Hymenobacter lutimineralis]